MNVLQLVAIVLAIVGQLTIATLAVVLLRLDRAERRELS